MKTRPAVYPTASRAVSINGRIVKMRFGIDWATGPSFTVVFVGNRRAGRSHLLNAWRLRTPSSNRPTTSLRSGGAMPLVLPSCVHLPL